LSSFLILSSLPNISNLTNPTSENTQQRKSRQFEDAAMMIDIGSAPQIIFSTLLRLRTGKVVVIAELVIPTLDRADVRSRPSFDILGIKVIRATCLLDQTKEEREG
jgi:hypothetical protein